MIDTNQVQQIADTATAMKSQLSPFVPALTVAAAWLGRELSRFNTWAVASAGKIIAHGGLVKIAVKIFWNKNA